MNESLQESGEVLKTSGLQTMWDLATELVKTYGKEDDEYGFLNVTWQYSPEGNAIYVEDLPGLNTYGGTKVSPQMSILVGKVGAYNHFMGRNHFDIERSFVFDAGEKGHKLFGRLQPEAIEQFLMTDFADGKDRKGRLPTETEITEAETLLSFALADLNDQKRRKVAQGNLTKVARQATSISSKNGKLEYLDTWLASLIEEYDPKDH